MRSEVILHKQTVFSASISRFACESGTDNGLNEQLIQKEKYMGNKIKPLNDSLLGNLSIEELENRLQMEELDIRGEMWTGCSCADKPCTTYCPYRDQDCPSDAASAPQPGGGSCSWYWEWD